MALSSIPNHIQKCRVIALGLVCLGSSLALPALLASSIRLPDIQQANIVGLIGIRAGRLAIGYAAPEISAPNGYSRMALSDIAQVPSMGNIGVSMPKAIVKQVEKIEERTAASRLQGTLRPTVPEPYFGDGGTIVPSGCTPAMYEAVGVNKDLVSVVADAYRVIGRVSVPTVVTLVGRGGNCSNEPSTTITILPRLGQLASTNPTPVVGQEGVLIPTGCTPASYELVPPGIIRITSGLNYVALTPGTVRVIGKGGNCDNEPETTIIVRDIPKVEALSVTRPVVKKDEAGKLLPSGCVPTSYTIDPPSIIRVSGDDYVANSIRTRTVVTVTAIGGTCTTQPKTQITVEADPCFDYTGQPQIMNPSCPGYCESPKIITEVNGVKVCAPPVIIPDPAPGMGQCIGTVPANAKAVIGGKTPITTANVNRTYSTDANAICPFVCNDGFSWDGAACVKLLPPILSLNNTGGTNSGAAPSDYILPVKWEPNPESVEAEKFEYRFRLKSATAWPVSAGDWKPVLNTTNKET
jgi:hypothetical protein